MNLNEFHPPTLNSPASKVQPIPEKLPIEDKAKEVENTENITEQVSEKQVTVPVIPSKTIDNTQEFQEMTKRLLEKIANIEAKEINTTKITKVAHIKVIKKPIFKPKKIIKKDMPKKVIVKEEPIKTIKPKKTFKMIIKDPIIKEREKPKKINKKKKIKKLKIKKKSKKKVKKQKRKKFVRKKQYISQDPLANTIMSTSTSRQKINSNKPAMRMIKQFYGSEFNTFTKTQKRFIEKNLGGIYQITQRTLSRNGYPHLALNTRQQGTAIVTFYLHPNGNISGLRLKKRIGYASLDKNTIKVIRIAYKDYPRPKTKTKITFYVEYSLF